MLEATGFTRPIGAGARIVSGDNQVSPRRSGRLPRQPHPADGARRRRRPRQWRPGRARRVEQRWPRSAPLCSAASSTGSASRSTGSARSARSTNGRSPAAPDNPLARARVTEPFDTGVRAVNAMLTAGVGQRIAIVAGSGVGKSVLMGQMIAGADADVIVVGLIGERSREVSDFLATKLPPEVRRKSVVVAVPADHAPLLRLRAAMRATAIAEDFRARGLQGAAARRQPHPRRPCPARDRPLARRAADGEGLSALRARPDPAAGRARRRRRR